jgi:hypothetical protein
MKNSCFRFLVPLVVLSTSRFLGTNFVVNGEQLCDDGICIEVDSPFTFTVPQLESHDPPVEILDKELTEISDIRHPASDELSLVGEKYHVVRVGTVEPTGKDTSPRQCEIPSVKESWLQTKRYRPHGHQVLAYYENAPAHFKSGRSFYDSFVRAYNIHLDLVLGPDDVWIMICLQVSYYVKENAEQMRSLFVSHERKKTLTVFSELELKEDQWGA